nr:thioredoxin-like fold protein [Tanacetum cinerariifolium]
MLFVSVCDVKLLGTNRVSKHQRSESFKVADSIKGKLPGTEDRVVVYFTSLRGIRRTYEDCYSVRMILKFFRVTIDERDISMDAEYRKELLRVLSAKNVSLPQVFVRGKHIGGADVVKQLHETGQLATMLKGLPVRSSGAWEVCKACGDVRFVPCANCSGSKKVFDEDDDMLKRCPDCNENGLIRCPSCCS